MLGGYSKLIRSSPHHPLCGIDESIHPAGRQDEKLVEEVERVRGSGKGGQPGW